MHVSPNSLLFFLIDVSDDRLEVLMHYLDRLIADLAPTNFFGEQLRLINVCVLGTCYIEVRSGRIHMLCQVRALYDAKINKGSSFFVWKPATQIWDIVL